MDCACCGGHRAGWWPSRGDRVDDTFEATQDVQRMPRGTKPRKASEKDAHTHIAVHINRFEVRSSAGINHHAREPRYAYRDPDDEFLYQFQTHLDIAKCLTQDRAGDAFGLTVYAESSPASGNL
ncbi:MAG: hypothetical protein U5R48_15550 [Gammaproteobacteria bacterium]|nr:hypothetical protein [Gammaproteobacteria bacterium]